MVFDFRKGNHMEGPGQVLSGHGEFTPYAREVLRKGVPDNPEPMHTFETGAHRSEKIQARYDLIPPVFLRRLALRYGLGAEKYAEHNWQKGLPLSDTLNHIEAHLQNFIHIVQSLRIFMTESNAPTQEEKDVYLTAKLVEYWRSVEASASDDDLAGAAWGIAAIMWFLDTGKVKL